MAGPSFPESLTLRIQRHRLAYRNPLVAVIALATPEALDCLAPESFAFSQMLTGQVPLAAGQAMYLTLAIFQALPPEARRLALEFLEFLQIKHAPSKLKPPKPFT